jgi:hypothetical protein
MRAGQLDDDPSWRLGIFLGEISERTGVPPIGQNVKTHLNLVLPDLESPMARIAAALCDAPEIDAQNKFLRRNICLVDVLA